jgi:hypothetical protein
MIASSPFDKARFSAAAFKSEQEFVVVGLKTVKFWTLSGRNISYQKGTFGG